MSNLNFVETTLSNLWAADDKLNDRGQELAADRRENLLKLIAFTAGWQDAQSVPLKGNLKARKAAREQYDSAFELTPSRAKYAWEDARAIRQNEELSGLLEDPNEILEFFGKVHFTYHGRERVGIESRSHLLEFLGIRKASDAPAKAIAKACVKAGKTDLDAIRKVIESAGFAKELAKLVKQDDE